MKGVFRHCNCKRVFVLPDPFPEFMCSNYVRISKENDFRMRVRREEFAIEKRGSRGTRVDRQLGYL
jgi:hypothetical protein